MENQALGVVYAEAAPAVRVQDRQVSLDILKGAGIILVVGGHLCADIVERGLSTNPSLLEAMYFCLYSFHMPLFFMIAGFHAERSIDKHGAADFLKSRVWKSIYPYFLWSFLIWAPKYALAGLLAIQHPLQLYDIVNVAWRPISVYWFLYVVFIAQMLALLFHRRGAFLILTALMLETLVFYLQVPRAHILNLFCVHLIFFALGFFVSERRMSLTPTILASPLALLSSSCVFGLGCYAALSHRVEAPVGLLTLPVSLGGIALFIGLVANCPTAFLRDGLNAIGRRSLPIYIMHIFFIPIVLLLARKLGIGSDALILLGGTAIAVAGSQGLYSCAVRFGLDDWLGLSGKSPFRAPIWARG